MNYLNQNIAKALSAQGNIADRSSPPPTGGSGSVRRQILTMDKEHAVARQRDYETFRAGLAELLNAQVKSKIILNLIFVIRVRQKPKLPI